MTTLLQWLVEHAWILYAVCAVGAVFYVVRALTAYRERDLALFTLERETATSRAVRAWAMVLVFITIGVAILFSVTIVLPGLPIPGLDGLRTTPTSAAGVELLTPGVTLTPSPTIGLLVPTFTPLPTGAAIPTPIPPPAAPTSAPTDTPTGAIAGEMNVRFGDFAALVGYSVPAAEITTAQPLQLTLYWRALEGSSPMDYMVFTHLLSESGDVRLVAQDDDQPADAVRPTTTWVAGETIVDIHLMAFLDTAYTGPVRIEVGLYNPSAAGERVMTSTGADRVVLPVSLNVVSQ